MCRRLDTIKIVLKGTSHAPGVIWFAVNTVSPCHCGCPPGQAEDVSDGRLQKTEQLEKRECHFKNEPESKICRPDVFSYHRDASWCCTSVAAADRFTCRLVVKRLTAAEDRVVVQCVHQVRVHVTKEQANLLQSQRNDSWTEEEKKLCIWKLNHTLFKYILNCWISLVSFINTYSNLLTSASHWSKLRDRLKD